MTDDEIKDLERDTGWNYILLKYVHDRLKTHHQTTEIVRAVLTLALATVQPVESILKVYYQYCK